MCEYKIKVPVESGRACSFAPSAMHGPACRCTLEVDLEPARNFLIERCQGLQTGPH